MAGALREDAKQYMARSERTLEAAQVLAEHGYWRDVLSKTYFAMFYAASALLASKGISRSKHSGIHSALGQYFVKPGLIEPQYSRMLINAFNVRLDSDYDVQFVERVTAYLQQEGYR